MCPTISTRRDLLRTPLALCGISALSSSCSVLGDSEGAPHTGGTTGALSSEDGADGSPLLALSLKELQRRASGRGPVRRLLGGRSFLGDLSMIHGFVVGDDGDVIVYGAKHPVSPPVETDALVVALRNAWSVGGDYEGVPGCTIDPREGAPDPWAIQDVTVFGMPASCSMARRAVALDYELKRIGAGLQAEPIVPSSFEQWRRQASICGREGHHDQASVHRYWFYPSTPEAPRFRRDGDSVSIDKPIGVQLLSEKEFLDRTGTRQGAARSDPLAQRFADQVTAVLASESVPRYVQLLADFRWNELAKLMKIVGIAEEALAFFLWEYPLEEYEVEPIVAGVFREESGKAMCGASTKRVREGFEIQRQVSSYRYEYRGGVEADVVLREDEFARDDGALVELRRRIVASRPAAGALSWTVQKKSGASGARKVG